MLLPSQSSHVRFHVGVGTRSPAIKRQNATRRIVGSRGGTSRWNKVLNNIFYHCGKAIEFANRDNTAEGNLYLRDWGEVGDES